jgi:hypothetical protein
MMVNSYEIDRLASNLEDRARDEDDLKSAKMLRELYRVFDAARDVVLARNHQQSMAAYAELRDMFQGKKGD